MNTDISGKRAIVAGASGGMGEAISRGLANEGVAQALLGTRQDKLAALRDQCAALGVTALPVRCDLAETPTIAPAVEQAVASLGGLDFLINCAGIYRGGRAQEAALEDWDTMLDINLKAHYHLVRSALPEINKRRGGAVIKIGSISGSYPGAGMHLATSRGQEGYGEALFEDVREFGTKVCTIRPGFVNTPLAASARLDPARMIQPEDIARTVLFVLTMPDSVCPTEIVLRPQQSPYRES